MRASTVLLAAALSAAVSAKPLPVPTLLDNQELAVRADQGYFTPVKEPSYFTSAFATRAVDTTIIANNGTRVPGQAGAYGHFRYRINSDQKTICWDIRTVGLTGEYQSPAVTATHIHQAPAGQAGPPRLAFPNPTFTRVNQQGQEIRDSRGCAAGPFRTGINAANTTTDTGTSSGFRLRDIETDGGSGFFTDVHTKNWPNGAVRGQLLRSETPTKAPATFDAILKVNAKPEEVVAPNGNTGVGKPGASGFFDIKINSREDTICYGIDLSNLGQDPYFSPAKTGVHIHQAGKGANGPPRLALVNALTQNDGVRRSGGCFKGPFTTGLLDATTGIDTGSASGFKLSDIVANPSAFAADAHLEKFTAGAVRGQLQRA